MRRVTNSFEEWIGAAAGMTFPTLSNAERNSDLATWFASYDLRLTKVISSITHSLCDIGYVTVYVT